MTKAEDMVLLGMRILTLVWQCNQVESGRISRSSVEREDERSDLCTADSGQFMGAGGAGVRILGPPRIM